MSQILKLTTRELGPFLKDMWTNHPQEPILLTGLTGCGKSAVTRKTAIELYKEEGYNDIRLAGKEPTDLIGAMVPVPFETSAPKKTRGRATSEQPELTGFSQTQNLITPGITTFFPPGDMPYQNVPGFQKEGVLCLDEFHQAPAPVLNLAYSLVYDRMAGQNKIREGWRIIAIGNLREERTFQEELPEPLRRRFTHVQLTHDLDSYIEFYLKDNPGEMIIPSFLRFSPGQLHEADPDGTGGFPCPGSWSRAGQYLKTGGDYAGHKIEGSVGSKTWALLSAFMQIMTDQNQKLPAAEALKNPEKLDVDPKNPGLAWAHATRISNHIREEVLKAKTEKEQVKIYGMGMNFFIHNIWKTNMEAGRLGVRMMRESLGDKGTELTGKDYDLLAKYLEFYGDVAMM